jgi:hypothetical protein
VELEDWDGNSTYAEYDYFAVTDEGVNYTMSLGKYSAGKYTLFISLEKALNTKTRSLVLVEKTLAHLICIENLY